MSEAVTIELGELAPKVPSLNPANFPDEIFDLLSIPAYDAGNPQVVTGSEIGSSKQLVQPGDVMISKIVPHIRRVWIVPPPTTSGRRQLASSEWIVFRTDKVLNRWLRFYLLSDIFHAQFMNTVAGVGGSLLRARPQFVKQIKLTVPPLAIQEKEAEIEELKATIQQKRERQQALYRELETSLFISIFGNPESWPNNHEMTTIGDLAESTQYGTSSKAGPAGEYPVLRMGNITDDGKLDLSDLKYMNLSPDEVEKYTVRKGDLLFNRTNSKEKVGKAAVVLTDQQLAYAGYLVRVRFKNPDHAHFVAAFLNSNYGKKLRQKLAKTAVNQANINATELAKISTISPDRSINKRYLEIIKSIYPIDLDLSQDFNHAKD